MNVSRLLLRPVVIAASIGAIGFFSGCTTPQKSAKSSPKPAPGVSAATSPEILPVTAAAAKAPAAPVTDSPATETPKSTPAPAAEPSAQPAAALPAVVVPVRHATIIGSQETSILLDNFTAFVSSVDGRKVESGRNGWNVPLSIDIGHRVLGVEFNRGVFYAKGQVEFEAAANARYELKYATDAELFGKNSYCNFWVVEIESGQTVSLVSKASVEKHPETAAKASLLP